MPTTLTITINDDGKLAISGPIENKLVCYGMLELAKEAVREFSAKQQRPLVSPVSVIPSLGANGRVG